MKRNIIIGLSLVLGLIIINALLSDSPETTMVENNAITLPQEVTDNFPAHPHTKIINQNQTNGEDGRIFYSFSLEAEASIKEINDWYRESLNQGGWIITSDRNIGGYQVIQAEKDNLFISMQAARGDSSNTSIISQQAQIRP